MPLSINLTSRVLGIAAVVLAVLNIYQTPDVPVLQTKDDFLAGAKDGSLRENVKSYTFPQNRSKSSEKGLLGPESSAALDTFSRNRSVSTPQENVIPSETGISGPESSEASDTSPQNRTESSEKGLLAPESSGIVDATPRNRSVSIFYNIFVPPSNISNALRIIDEQLSFRRNSALATAPVYYTQIGALNVSIDCPPPCKRIHATEDGNETVTLQSLYEHCLAHPDELVVYIHDKGSFTVTDSNERLRRTLTKAVFSDECSTMPVDSGCDTCSARFMGYPYAHSPGNMWVAECAYIQKLIPPKDFGLAKEEMMRKVWNDEEFTKRFQRRKLRFYPLSYKEESAVSIGRFAMEAWVHSHPRLRPCDVYPSSDWDGREVYLTAPSSQDWIPDRQPAPRYAFNWKEMRYHPWFLLPGRIYHSIELYSLLPLQDSWFWTYYGDHFNASLLKRPAKNEEDHNRAHQTSDREIALKGLSVTRVRGHVDCVEYLEKGNCAVIKCASAIISPRLKPACIE